MASSGSFNTTSADGRYLVFKWNIESQSVADNTSTISWSLVGAGTSGYVTCGNFKVVIDGDTVYSSSERIRVYVDTVVASGTKIISHNIDGTRSFAASAQAGIYAVAVNCKGSGSWSLTAIPRGATILSAPNFNDEENPTITYSNPAGTAVDSLEACISLTGDSADISYRTISKTGTSYTFNLTEAERNVLRNATPNSNTLTVKFYIRTVIGDQRLHNSVSKTLTIVNGAPVISPTVKDTGAVSTVLTGDPAGTVIKGYNNMNIVFNASALKGATLKSQKVVSGSQSRTTDGKLSNVDSNVFTFTVTDSRGNTTTKVITKKLINYIKPTCQISNTEFTTDGVISFNIKGTFWSGSFGAVNNAIDVKYKLCARGGSGDWTATNPTVDASSNTYSVSISVSGLDYRKNYVLIAYVADSAYIWANDDAVYTPQQILSCIPVFDWGENDFQFNVPVKFNEGFEGDNITELETIASELRIDVSELRTDVSELQADVSKLNTDVSVLQGTIVPFGIQKILWDGAYYMHDGQTITLSEAVSQQPHGIVLIFSYYNSGAQNESFSSHFVPKEMVSLHPGKGHNFNLYGMWQNAVKYLYISDTFITGHDKNTGTQTVGGISLNNSYYVLRYVIGV